MTYRMLLWDFDGTIADTRKIALEIYNELAGQYHFNHVVETKGETLRNLSTQEFLKRAGISWFRLPLLVRRYGVLFQERVNEVELFPDIADLLTQLHHAGLAMGILSSNAAPAISDCLQKYQLQDCFQFIIGYPRLFGKAGMIRRILRQHQVPNDRLLYIGDEVRDIKAAHKANVAIAAVTWGFNSAEILRAEKPDYLIDEPGQLLERVLGRG